MCSNSLKSDSENTAPWLLKEEMRRAGSLLLEIARATRCARRSRAGGGSHGVFREGDGSGVAGASHHRSPRGDRAIDPNQITVIATGPLTSDSLAAEIGRLGESATMRLRGHRAAQLFFYDSISPIVEADSIDMEKVYLAARYDKGTADYINCPMSKEEYDRFYDALLSASPSKNASGKS